MKRFAKTFAAVAFAVGVLFGGMASAQQCIDPPGIDGALRQLYIGADDNLPGWNVYNSTTPDIISGNGPHPVFSITTVSDVNGASSSGGEMGLFAGYEGLQTVLSGLTVNQSYTVAVEWQQATTTSPWSTSGEGHLKMSAAGSTQTFTSSGSASGDTWQSASLTFTATGITETLTVQVVPGSLSQAYAGTIVIDSGNGCSLLVPSNPTITSATYDASTGTLVVTGTNFVANTGATNDVDASLLTFTGEGGATYTLTSADVEIDSATQFTITLNATDKAALAAILNKNGTASDDSTTYNIAAAEDWMPGAPGADTIADLTGNGVTMSGLDETAPTATISPSDGATSVAEDSTITITFSEAVRRLDGAALTNDNIAELITLKDTGGNGANIPFAVTINGNVVTITPMSNFAPSQQVYVAIGATLEDEADNAISPASATFTSIDYEKPSLEITGPTEPVTDAFPLTFTFSEDVTGFDVNDITIAGGSLTNFSGSGDTYTVIVTPVLGETITVSVAANAAEDAAGNGNEASETYTVQAGSPASEFEKYRDEIRQVVVDEAKRSLRSGLSANQRMVRGARDRLIAAQREQPECSEDDSALGNEETCDSELVTKNTVPLDVDGNFTLSENGLSTGGNFFQQVGNEEGTQRRLFFGDFDVQHDNDTDSTTATLTGRMAWEQMTSEQTLLGYFIGGELVTSTIGGSFEGDQDRIGVTAGGYVVHELAQQVYFDGFASVGAGRNNLEMANETLALESEYTTRTATLGGALTGVYSQKGYDFKPELAFSYGKTWLGDIGFTGRAYGLTDNTLSLDAGDVSIASLTFRPEVIIPIGADFVADTNTQLSFAPRLVCEQIKSTTKTSDCGTGGELGFSSNSEDGMSSADMRVLLDRINGGTRSSFVFSVEHRF